MADSNLPTMPIFMSPPPSRMGITLMHESGSEWPLATLRRPMNITETLTRLRDVRRHLANERLYGVRALLRSQPFDECRLDAHSIEVYAQIEQMHLNQARIVIAEGRANANTCHRRT